MIAWGLQKISSCCQWSMWGSQIICRQNCVYIYRKKKKQIISAKINIKCIYFSSKAHDYLWLCNICHPVHLLDPFGWIWNWSEMEISRMFFFFFLFICFGKHVCLWRSRDWQHQKLNLWIYLQPRYISDRCSHSHTALPMTLTPIWKDNLIYYKEERWFSLQPCWQSLGALWTQFVICVETSNHLVTWTISH